MADTAGGSPIDLIGRTHSFQEVREAVQDCRGCDLYRYATQAVFGEGPKKADLFLIGEQPGDQEDRQGHVFVGPAGKLLDRALADAGIDRKRVYLTNGVKHFKFEERGKRRIHKKPRASELQACTPWLEAEIAAVRPHVIVCLGATAASAVFGPRYRLTEQRGIFIEHPWAPLATSTVHPSAILRVRESDKRHVEYERFVGDLRKAKERIGGRRAAGD